jgi:hypothetical protein
MIMIEFGDGGDLNCIMELVLMHRMSCQWDSSKIACHFELYSLLVSI